MAHWAPLILCLVAATSGDRATAAERKPAWLKQYAALKCDPRSLHLQSRQPLRFASTAVCYKLPKDFQRVGYTQLVLIDAERDELRLVGFGTNAGDAAQLLAFDAAGNWFWLMRHDVMMLAPGESEPRRVASIDFPWEYAAKSHIGGGTGCQLFGKPTGPGIRDDSAPKEYALLTYGTDGARMRIVPEIRVPRFWHPLEKAYVVRNGERHSLVDCEGQPRPLSDRDEARLAQLGRPKVESYDIAANGDWLVDLHEDESSAQVFQGDDRRQLGPFNYLPRGCGHPDCTLSVYFFLPRWSPSSEFILMETFRRNTVIRAADFRTVKDWKLKSDLSAFISDREVLHLSKKHGAVFHRW